MINTIGPFPTLLAVPLSGSHAANRLGGKLGAGMDRSAAPPSAGTGVDTPTPVLLRR